MTNHRQATLDFLRSTRLIPVPIRAGQKDPTENWDARKSVSQDNSVVISYFERGEEQNIGALFCGRFVDLDIDCKNHYLEAALEAFLPQSKYTWGRSSKPASHRAFILHSDFDRSEFGSLFRFLKGGIDLEGAELSIELRGGKPEANFFTVLPGSMHPSGEMYEWDEIPDHTVTAPLMNVYSLVKSIRMAVATAIIAEYWVSGSRNDMSLHLSGLLWRIRDFTLKSFDAEDETEIGEEHFVLTRKDAMDILEAVIDMADENVADHRVRRINFKNTWNKLDKSPTAKVTGGKAMAELVGEEGEKIVKYLYRLLTDNESLQELEALADQFVIWYGQGVLVDLEMVEKGFDNPWMNREQARNSLGARKIKIGNKKLPISDMLFSIDVVKRVYGMTFDPSTKDVVVDQPKGSFVNQWRGFECEPIECKNPEVEPFIDYVRNVLASGDKDVMHWIMAWIADIVQCPDQKCKTALVFVGPQGAGKSFLSEQIMVPMIGNHHAIQVNSISHMTDKFNTSIDSRIFVGCEEAVHSWQKGAASVMKSIITDPFVWVEPKGINKFQKPNLMRFLFTSNEKTQSILIDPDPNERRYSVVEVGDQRCGDMNYWENMFAWVPENLGRIMWYLKNYKYDKKTIMRPLDTEIKKNMQQINIDIEARWIITRIVEGFPLAPRAHVHWYEAYNATEISKRDRDLDVLVRDVWPDTVTKSALEEDLRMFIRSMGRQVYTGSMGSSVQRVLPPGALKFAGQIRVKSVDPKSMQEHRERVRVYSFPTAEEIMNHVRRQYGSIVDEIRVTTENEMLTFDDDVDERRF